MGSRRGSSRDAAVMDLPEETFESSTDWRGRVPAGAWRERVGPGYPQEAFWRIGSEESPYVPKREMHGWTWRRLPRTTGGWVLWGSAVFLALGLVASAAYTVRYYLLHDDRFVVTTSSDIQIVGNEHLTRAQVLSVFGADLERNIFKVPLADRRADLERLPWVQHATVMRLLPHEIRVSITERTPVAFVRQGPQIGLVDAGGVLLDMPEQSAGDPKYSFPVLTGLNADDPLSTRAARMEIYHRFMTELDAGSPKNGQKLTETLSEVDVSNPEDLKALIASDGTDVLVHFGDEDFLTRYSSFELHLPEWRQQYPKLASADMRYADQIVLEMQKGTSVPLAEMRQMQCRPENDWQPNATALPVGCGEKGNSNDEGVCAKSTKTTRKAHDLCETDDGDARLRLHRQRPRQSRQKVLVTAVARCQEACCNEAEAGGIETRSSQASGRD